MGQVQENYENHPVIICFLDWRCRPIGSGPGQGFAGSYAALAPMVSQLDSHSTEELKLVVEFPISPVAVNGFNDSERVSTAVLQFPNKRSEVQEPSYRPHRIRIWLSETYSSLIYVQVSEHNNCRFSRF